MSHSNPTTLNPTGGAGDRRGLAQPALHDALMDAATLTGQPETGVAPVKSNHGAPGIDGLRIEDFPALYL